MNAKKLSIGILPGIADLYVRAWPDRKKDLEKSIKQIIIELKRDYKVFSTAPVHNLESVSKGSQSLLSHNIDLMIVALAPYCPSGVLAPILSKLDVPILLWPAQSMYELKPATYNRNIVMLNHGVHGIQDLANVLGKTDKNFGVIHGHLKQKDFKDDLNNWAQAGRAVRAMQTANPVQIGEHFEDMLDLQIGSDKFMQQLKLKPEIISCNGLAKILTTVNDTKIKRYMRYYRNTFNIADDVSKGLLEKTAKGEAAVREIMDKKSSVACGINFLELCNDRRITDGLHIAASNLMYQGCGYAAEGDWVTAVLVRAMQQVFGVASFSEMFSVGYADNRIALKHYGEGNYAMSRSKPSLCSSVFNDKIPAEFAIADFEFKPGLVTLINLNSTKDSQGQLITITGMITKDHLPHINGPRAILKPKCTDVRELLNQYAYNGGSHHLAMINGNCTKVFPKLAKLTGWKYIEL